MTYLSNAAVNRLTIHTALHMLAWSMAGNFFVVYLLSHGVSTVDFFLYVPVIYGLRLILRPMVLFVAPRIGSRRTLYIGTFFFALQYPLLAYVEGMNWVLWAYFASFALSNAFYWPTYHAIFAVSGDEKHRGKQIGLRESLVTVVNIVAPLIGGFCVDHIGSHWTFGVAAVIEMLALLPLYRVPDLPISRVRPKGAFSAVTKGISIFVTDGWIAVGNALVWSVMLFGATGDSFTTFGSALALTGFVSAIGGLLLGRLLDGTSARYAVLLNGAFLLTGILLKATAGPGLTAMLGIAAATALLNASYVPVLATAIYGLASKAPCPLRFTFSTESAWDVGCICSSLIIHALLKSGVAMGWAVSLGIPAAIVQTVLLRRYYRRIRAQA